MLVLLLLPVAWSYELSGARLAADQLPLEIHWSGTQTGLTADETRQAVEAAVAAWRDAGPCGFELVPVEDPDAEGWFEAGGVSVLFSDPQRALADGVLLLSLPGFAGDDSTAIVVNDTDDFLSDADIDGGRCTDQYSLQGLLTRELGILLGLADPCGSEVCTDEELQSTMSGAGECDTRGSTLAEDDRAGLAAIYGDFPFGFECTNDAADALTVTCAVTDPVDAVPLSATWTFGDGVTAEGIEVSHTYDRAALYPVELCMALPDCGEARCLRQVVYAEGPRVEFPDDEPEAGCGCATGRPGVAWGLVLAVLAALKRTGQGPRKVTLGPRG